MDAAGWGMMSDDKETRDNPFIDPDPLLILSLPGVVPRPPTRMIGPFGSYIKAVDKCPPPPPPRQDWGEKKLQEQSPPG